MSGRKAADEAIKGDAGRWWSLLFHVPWLSLVLLALLAAVVFGPMTRWDPWVMAYVPPEGPEDSLAFLAFSADGQRVLTCHWTFPIHDKPTKHLWIRNGPALRPRAKLRNCSGTPKRGAFSLDGKRVLIVNREDEIQVFDTASGTRTCLYPEHVEGYPEPKGGDYPFYLHARFSPDGRRVASWYGDGPRRGVRVWDASTANDVCSLKDQGGGADAVVWSRDGKQLATRAFDSPSSLAEWNAEIGRRVRTLGSEKAPIGHVAAFCYGPDGLRVLSLGHKGNRILDESGGAICVLEGAPFIGLNAYFSPDGSKVAASWITSHVAWWDVESGRLLGKARLSGWRTPLIAFSHDARRLITVNPEGTFCVHDAETGGLLIRLELARRIQGLLSADATRLASQPGYWGGDATLCFRRRPEWWWGVFYLPEFWLAVALGAAFVWSAVRDVRRWRKRRPTG